MKSFLQEKFSTCLKRKHSIRYLWRISRTWIPKYHKNHCQKSLNTIWLSTVWTTRYGVQTDWTQSIGEMHAIFISFYCTYFSLCPISSKIKNNNANGTHTICSDTPKATMIILSTRKKKYMYLKRREREKYKKYIFALSCKNGNETSKRLPCGFRNFRSIFATVSLAKRIVGQASNQTAAALHRWFQRF